MFILARQSKTDAKNAIVSRSILYYGLEGSRFDLTQKGNANGGHSYGTELSEPDKRALIGRRIHC
ncbi:MAG: hypothetical protein QOI46_6491 [Alphaproteobacteria bacterium]|jgi:hypothetical protein|nr:hypothetical protein [Alphaproteobacteria bacterium]